MTRMIREVSDMNGNDTPNQKSEMSLYTTADGGAKIESSFDGETVWLSIDQMEELF